ncbi:MAG: RIP metalloprotease RseP [Candidatus Eremiobacteraeota bacterium]|nr:RIP metalloprotease RseP [Candidatus Eremiobacteraeota bacterium]
MMLAALALPALASLGKIVVFLIMLSVLVVLHELGHFIVARLNHVRVNDFALGMGPTILCWTSPRTGTNYRLNLLPIGGYCAMQGEDGKTNEARQQREFRELPATGDDENFQAKAPWRRLAIVAAGPVANFITAFVFMVAIAVGFGTPVATPTVGVLQPNMPAQRAGLRPGDRIVAVDSHAISSGEDLVELIHRSAHKRLHLEVRRGAQTFGIDVTPVERTLAGQKVGLLGFAPRQEMHRAGFIEGVSQAAFTFWSVVTLQLGILSALVTTPAQTFSGLSGPVGIAAISGQYQDLGWGPYLFLAAQISISLGIFNFLPIPALDGGRGVFIVAELFRGKPVDPEKEAFVHFAGFAALMLLMVFVTYHDILRLVAGKGVL